VKPSAPPQLESELLLGINSLVLGPTVTWLGHSPNDWNTFGDFRIGAQGITSLAGSSVKSSQEQRTETLFAHAVGKWSDADEHLAV